MKKFAVVLSGCGVFDGTEIHEATMTMLAIKQNNAEYDLFAPDVNQHHVINHLTGEEMNETRNVLIESARIGRGNVKPLVDFDAIDYDYLIFPGGFGAAKNLSSFAFDGANCSILPQVKIAVNQMIDLKKPIGALCIAPAVIAKLVGKKVNVTIGSDPETANAIEKMNARHIETDHGDVVLDEEYHIFSTPCYMLDADISQIYDGAFNIVEAIINYEE
ncbi:MAG: isoprenoid biosynthesis glyoxalase ElbB [Bacteroidales bacterium]